MSTRRPAFAAWIAAFCPAGPGADGGEVEALGHASSWAKARTAARRPQTSATSSG